MVARAKGWLFLSYIALGSILIGVGLGVLTDIAYRAIRPPGQVIMTTEDDGVAFVGGDLVELFHTKKSRSCTNVVARWLVQPDGKVLGHSGDMYWPLSTSPSPPTRVGQDYYGIHVQLPNNLAPGRYYYVSRTTHQCGLGDFFNPPATQTPPVPVRVELPATGSQPTVLPAPGPVELVPAQESKP